MHHKLGASIVICMAMAAVWRWRSSAYKRDWNCAGREIIGDTTNTAWTLKAMPVMRVKCFGFCLGRWRGTFSISSRTT